MSETKKRFRKPTQLLYSPDGGGYQANKARISTCGEYPVQIDSNRMSLKQAKEIHNWLGRAISYLEQAKGER